MNRKSENNAGTFLAASKPTNPVCPTSQLLGLSFPSGQCQKLTLGLSLDVAGRHHRTQIIGIWLGSGPAVCDTGQGPQKKCYLRVSVDIAGEHKILSTQSPPQSREQLLSTACMSRISTSVGAGGYPQVRLSFKTGTPKLAKSQVPRQDESKDPDSGWFVWLFE